MNTIAGCSIHDAKDPFWFMGLWYSKNISFTITLLVGLSICLFGKHIWKIVNFISGFGLLMTIMFIVMYPAFVRKGYRMNW